MIGMSVASSCEICRTAGVSDTCVRCSQLVCTEHFDDETGQCAACVAETGSGGSDTPTNIPTGDETDLLRF
ncbi:MAG: hypothetical protein J07HX5_02082 [halophilic archaeon J07HX5]|nr:MAG: hypothetical protein J07HX5_02082 [halophilic archaeon J07HX5]